MKKIFMILLISPLLALGQYQLPPRVQTNVVKIGNYLVRSNGSAYKPFDSTQVAFDLRYAPITGGSNYVPKTLTITVNGVTLDLSANRSFSAGTVTSLVDNTANGVTISWANRTTNAVPSILLGDITPTSINSPGSILGSAFSTPNGYYSGDATKSTYQSRDGFRATSASGTGTLESTLLAFYNGTWTNYIRPNATMFGNYSAFMPILTANETLAVQSQFNDYLTTANAATTYLGIHATADNALKLNAMPFTPSVGPDPINSMMGRDVNGLGYLFTASAVNTFLGTTPIYVNFATATGDGTTTAFNFGNLASFTPSNVIWTPMSAAAAGDWYITNITSTGYTLNFVTPPPSGGGSNITGKFTLIK